MCFMLSPVHASGGNEINMDTKPLHGIRFMWSRFLACGLPLGFLPTGRFSALLYVTRKSTENCQSAEGGEMFTVIPVMGVNYCGR